MSLMIFFKVLIFMIWMLSALFALTVKALSSGVHVSRRGIMGRLYVTGGIPLGR